MLDYWHSAVFRDIISKYYDPIILFVEDRIKGEIFSWEKIMIRFPGFFRSCDKRVLFSWGFWTIAALMRGFMKRLRFFLPVFWPFYTQGGDWNFLFLCLFCHFQAWVVLEGFLMISWRITWGLPSRRLFFLAIFYFNRFYFNFNYILF